MRLIYCAAGNRRFAEIALRHSFSYGAQMPNTIYYPPSFIDQDWRNPDKNKYISALAQHEPDLATVLDLENENQLEQVLAWGTEAAPFVKEAIIIIPKVQGIISQIPREISGKQIRLGYSVPTGYAGTSLPLWDFAGWPVHLLGGSPQKQMELAGYMDVKSADGNYAMKMATSRNQFFWAGGTARWSKNRFWPQLKESVYGNISRDAPYMAFELSCINIQAAWNGCPTGIRWAVEEDIIAIKKLAHFYNNELGYVTYPSLRSGIKKRELYVADYGHRTVGFCNWHQRLDGWSTIYEIAVHPHHTGQNIGSSLINSIPPPIRLKCPVDNFSNGFYWRIGFKLERTEPGLKRPLNLWVKV